MKNISKIQKRVYFPLLSLAGICVIGIIYTSIQNLDALTSSFTSLLIFSVILLMFVGLVQELTNLFIVDKRYARGNYPEIAVKYRVWKLSKNTSSLSSVRKKGRLLFNKTYIRLHKMHFRTDEIQWCGRDTNSHDIRLDVNTNNKWYVIKIDTGYKGQEFIDNLMKVLPKSLKQSSNLYRPNVRSHNVVSAHITKQNLQGIYENQQAVGLYITPLWIVILEDGYVIAQHFIDDVTDTNWNKHPQALDDDMYLVKYTLHDETFTYALSDNQFIAQLTQVMYGDIEEIELRKRK